MVLVLLLYLFLHLPLCPVHWFGITSDYYIMVGSGNTLWVLNISTSLRAAHHVLCGFIGNVPWQPVHGCLVDLSNWLVSTTQLVNWFFQIDFNSCLRVSCNHESTLLSIFHLKIFALENEFRIWRGYEYSHISIKCKFHIDFSLESLKGSCDRVGDCMRRGGGVKKVSLLPLCSMLWKITLGIK